MTTERTVTGSTLLSSLGILVVLLATAGCSQQGKSAGTDAAASATALPAPLPSGLAPVAPSTHSGPVAKPGPGARLEDERNTIDIFRTAAPAAVFVTQKRLVRDWAMRAMEVPAGSGTGFIWDTAGHVVTNFHVIDPGNAAGTSYTVTLYNQKSYEAKLVGGEPNKDIAVLKIAAPAAELTPLQVPPAGQQLEVGQKTIAIGNPFGLDHTLTTGVISALGREVDGYGGVTIRDMIQTDASINPGNSGGPLLDSSGMLIGMNTMIFSKSGSSAGIGFAVPVGTIRRMVPQIIQFGRPKRAGLGIRMLPDRVAARAGVRGVIIADVSQGSPAAQAGLQGLRQTNMGEIIVGDVVVGIDEHEIKDYDDLYNALDRYRIGDEVTVKVQRDSKIVTVRLKLSEVQ